MDILNEPLKRDIKMAISSRNKVSVSFSSTGMTDVALLPHFFMLTSTLVHPTALKLVLPKGSTQTSAKPQTTVSVTSDQRYYWNNNQ